MFAEGCNTTACWGLTVSGGGWVFHGWTKYLYPSILARCEVLHGQAVWPSDWLALPVASHFTPAAPQGPSGSRAPIGGRVAQPARWASACRWCLPPTSKGAEAPERSLAPPQNPSRPTQFVSIPSLFSLLPHRPSFRLSNPPSASPCSSSSSPPLFQCARRCRRCR